MREVDQVARVAKVLAAQRTRLDGLFEERRFEIVGEVTPAFLEAKGRDRLRSPLGNLGRNGYLVALVDGPDINPGVYAEGSINRDKRGRQWFFVGARVLGQMSTDYGAVDLP